MPKDQRAVIESDIAAQNFKNMFVLVSRTNEEMFRYYSTDGGVSFNKVDVEIDVFGYDPHDPTGLRLLGYNVFNPSYGLLESLDGGKTWHFYSSLPREVSEETRISNIVWDPTNKDVVYLSGDGARVWKSEDKAKTWQTILSLDMLK